MTKEKFTYPWSTVEYTLLKYERADLEKMNTHQLLRLLRAGDLYLNSPSDDWMTVEQDGYWIKEVSRTELKEVLATRPHIPNKKERRKNINAMKGKQKKVLKYKK